MALALYGVVSSVRRSLRGISSGGYVGCVGGGGVVFKGLMGGGNSDT